MALNIIVTKAVAMSKYPNALLVFFILLQFSVTASAGTLDDYYLQQFGAAKSDQLQKAILSVSTDAQESARCGMPLKKGLRRDWNLLEASTQKILAKQLASPVLASPATYASPAGHFTVHYATTGTDAPPPTDVSGVIGVPDWVETVAATFEAVYASYGSLGYQPAPTAAGAPYDIYLLDLAPEGFYGVTTSDQLASSTSYPNAITSWIELDNNYTDNIYHPATYLPLQSLQITAAHEYHHAIQYGYNYYFDTWYAEATSTWMEDELYDGVNQLYNYIPAWFSNSRKPLDLAVGADAVTVGAGYGRWIFNRYLAEKHTPAMIRTAWETLVPLPSPGGGADIPMVPVLDSLLSSSYGTSLGNDFFGFAKRVYQRDWITHISETSKIPDYSPITTYPVTTTTVVNTSVTLSHYSFACYTFTPSFGAPTNLALTVTGTTGIKATAFIKSGSSITEYPFSTVNGTTVTIPGFKSSSEAVLLVANTTDVDNHQVYFSTDGTLAAATEPTTTPATSTSGSSSGGGCFIATAAYGSYLHPQVQQLRHFRDNYLLTNIPGRAFVTLYYHYSPPLAEFIARHPFLRSVTRLFLTPIIIAVVHPVAAGTTLLLTGSLLLYRPLRRRYLGRVIA